MATYTTKLNLIKPELNDYIAPSVFAQNFDKIDNAFMGVASISEVNSVKSSLNNLKSTVSTLQTSVSNQGIRIAQLESYVDDLYTELANIGTLLDEVNGEVI